MVGLKGKAAPSSLPAPLPPPYLPAQVTPHFSSPQIKLCSGFSTPPPACPPPDLAAQWFLQLPAPRSSHTAASPVPHPRSNHALASPVPLPPCCQIKPCNSFSSLATPRSSQAVAYLAPLPTARTSYTAASPDHPTRSLPAQAMPPLSCPCPPVPTIVEHGLRVCGWETEGAGGAKASTGGGGFDPESPL